MAAALCAALATALVFAPMVPLAAQGAGGSAPPSGKATGTAERPVGTVAPGAIGEPLRQPAPIGGLRTNGPVGDGGAVRGPAPGRFGSVGVIPLRVVDAALPRGGAVVIPGGAARAPRFWTPSIEPPRWVIDSTAARVDAWRDILVRDVWCSAAGPCIERQGRLRARWNARCDCYLFADALGRIWRVE